MLCAEEITLTVIPFINRLHLTPSALRSEQLELVEGSRGRGLHSIADTLNTRGIPTARGKTWTAMQVSNVLARADR
jgi:hypothetical protein